MPPVMTYGPFHPPEFGGVVIGAWRTAARSRAVPGGVRCRDRVDHASSEVLHAETRGHHVILGASMAMRPSCYPERSRRIPCAPNGGKPPRPSCHPTHARVRRECRSGLNFPRECRYARNSPRECRSARYLPQNGVLAHVSALSGRIAATSALSARACGHIHTLGKNSGRVRTSSDSAHDRMTCWRQPTGQTDAPATAHRPD